MLKILGRRTSGNTQKVLWCCDELGLAYEREDVGRGFGRNQEPAYLALNPNGRAWYDRLCERPAFRRNVYEVG